MDQPAVPSNQFDRSKPFYPLVSVYIAQLHGLKELGVRGALAILNQDRGTQTMDQVLDAVDLGEDEANALFRKLRGPLELASETGTDRLTIRVDWIARELAENVHYLFDYVMPAAGSILMLARQIVETQLPENHDPVLEFLRHCRNAVAHDGRLFLKGAEPKWPSSWRTLSVAPCGDGRPLFTTPGSPGVLGPANPIHLLWDIEQAYPSLTA